MSDSSPARIILLGVLLAALSFAACQPEEEDSRRRPLGEAPSPATQERLPEGHPEVPGMEGAASRSPDRRDLPPSVTVHLDSGNAAYRADDYRRARRHFHAAVEADSSVAAGWFGVYMAERALGNDRAADSALRRAGATGAPSDVHHAPGIDSGGGMTPDPQEETTDS